MYAGHVAAGCGWLLSSAAARILLLSLAFPAGGLSTFGVFGIGVIALIVALLWGGSIVAAHKHVREWNRDHGIIS
jgi:hypothetical protein